MILDLSKTDTQATRFAYAIAAVSCDIDFGFDLAVEFDPARARSEALRMITAIFGYFSNNDRSRDFFADAIVKLTLLDDVSEIVSIANGLIDYAENEGGYIETAYDTRIEMMIKPLP